VSSLNFVSSGNQTVENVWLIFVVHLMHFNSAITVIVKVSHRVYFTGII